MHLTGPDEVRLVLVGPLKREHPLASGSRVRSKVDGRQQFEWRDNLCCRRDACLDENGCNNVQVDRPLSLATMAIGSGGVLCEWSRTT